MRVMPPRITVALTTQLHCMSVNVKTADMRRVFKLFQTVMVYYGSQDVHTTHRVSEYVLLVGVTVAGNPHDLPAMYAAVATDRSGHVGLIRPAIHSPGGVTLVNLLRTDTDQKWINSQSRLPVYQTVH